MPLYEYKCKKCGFSFEVIQKVSDPLLETCIKCGGPLEKVISAPALQFKGQGWYVTDYAQKANPEKEEKPVAEKQKSEKDDSQKNKKTKSSSSSE